MRVNVIGLGKLGLVLAALYAKAGHHVVGIDEDTERISHLDKGTFRSVEPGLDGLLASIRQGPWNLDFHSSYSEVAKQDFTFVVVPTPTNEHNGSYDLTIMRAVFKELAQHFLNHGRQHTFIITSTVNPGDTHRLKERFCEDSKMDGLQARFIYSPEFIALGDVIDGMKHPDLVLVGSQTQSDHDRFLALATSVCQDAPFYGTTLKNAELAKITLNSFITMKISFANMIADICEKFEGGNADAVLQIVGADRRVGPHCLRPGGPFGGPCFPRDNRALGWFASQLGTFAPLPAVVDEINEQTYERILERIFLAFEENPKLNRLVILGRTYKPDTEVTTESLGQWLVDYYASGQDNLIMVESWDPLLDGEMVLRLNEEDMVVLATPSIQNAHRANLEKAGVLFDVWGMLSTPYNNTIRLGRG